MHDPAGQRLRLLSFNIAVAGGSHQVHHYLTHSWKYLMPDIRRFSILNRIARLVSEYDIVALQETDAGSFRSHYTNLTEYLAQKAQFAYWYDQVNRNFGPMAQHSQGLLSRIIPSEVSEHRLTGLIPGRSAMFIRFGHGNHSLVLVGLHLALGRRARLRQIDQVCELISDYRHAAVMGDLNCEPDSKEMKHLLKKGKLIEPLEHTHTYPSWRPSKKLDHILVSPTLSIEHVHVPGKILSDHLPIAMDIKLPPELRLLG